MGYKGPAAAQKCVYHQHQGKKSAVGNRTQELNYAGMLKTPKKHYRQIVYTDVGNGWNQYTG